MARYTEHSRDNIDTTVDRWKAYCLLGDGSLVIEGRAGVWTAANVTELRGRFNDNQLQGAAAGGTFSTKWAAQMNGASDDVRLLAAELLLVHFLFTSSVRAAKKREVVALSLDSTGIDLPKDAPAVKALSEGIGGPGVGFNTRRDLQVAYLIDFVDRFKALDAMQGGALLDDPWALRDFADDTTWPIREMRHIVLHLLRPDDFERISSGTHKREIAAAFAKLLPDDAPADVDERLLQIRGALEDYLPDGNRPKQQLDFYYPPLRGVWESSGGGDGDGAGDIEALEWKKQIVLYGPPGTSKTWQAARLAEAVIRRAALDRWGPEAFFRNSAHVDALVEQNTTWLQLHPSYGYEHFIRGLRIEGDATRYRPGALPNLVAALENQDTPEGLPALPGVLVLDEINRTDLSAMLGEAFSLLERDQRGKTRELPGFDHGQEPTLLVIPEDLYVIGTMNEIDQSVETLDFALRRRFLWKPCPFERETLLEIVEARWEEDVRRYAYEDAADQLDRFADAAVKLNEAIAQSPELGSQYEIGHTYFGDLAFFLGTWVRGRSNRPANGTWIWTASGRPQPPLEGLWERSLHPLLEQYLAGSDVRDDELARLRGVLITG